VTTVATSPSSTNGVSIVEIRALQRASAQQRNPVE